MLYILSYKGKQMGEPMDQSKAEAVLLQMSRCLNNMEIVPYEPEQNVEPATQEKQLG